MAIDIKNPKDNFKVENALYLVATPIGNLLDISLRAIEVLKQVDIIYCEDTRVSSKLLSAYGIENKLSAYHEHNARKVRSEIIKKLQGGESVALISDAGTPIINDPGYKLVRDCYEHNIRVHSIPGASAPIVALTLSNMPSDKFLFAGFLEQKSNARKEQFRALLKNNDATIILFDSPKRIIKSLKDLMDITGGDIEVSVCRELTKRYEEIVHANLLEVLKRLEEKEAIKGEIVLLINPRSLNDSQFGDQEIKAEMKELLKNNRVKDVANMMAQRYNKSKKEMYNMALSIISDETTD